MATVVALPVEPEDSPEVEALLREGRDESQRPLRGRRLLADLLVGGVFLGIAVPLAIALPGPGSFRVLPAITLIVAYAFASRARLELGTGQTHPTLLVLVPMLFVLPPGTVPLCVAAGFLVADLPDVIKGNLHPSRTITAFGNALHAVGPALLLALADDPGGPMWSDWPIYLAALAAQFAFDMIPATLVPWIGSRARPQLQLAFLLRIWSLDALLAPVGLLAAFASRDASLGWLLLAPLIFVLTRFASERAARLGHALELSESRAQLLEAELRLIRAREETLGAVSHGMQRPVASLVGMSKLVKTAPGLSPARQMAADTMHSDAQELRHRLRQGLDYGALRAGQPLRVWEEDVDLAEAVRGVLAEGFDLTLEAPDEAIPVRTDTARLRQALRNLLENAIPHGARISVARDRSITVADNGPGLPDAVLAEPWVERARAEGADESHGPGIGLYVTGAIIEAIHATATVDCPPDGGTVVRITLPASA